jgi:hypothetical protein
MWRLGMALSHAEVDLLDSCCWRADCDAHHTGAMGESCRVNVDHANHVGMGFVATGHTVGAGLRGAFVRRHVAALREDATRVVRRHGYEAAPRAKPACTPAGAGTRTRPDRGCPC